MLALSHNRAEILVGLGRLEEARAAAEAGRAIGVALHGSGSPALVGITATLAQICTALGDGEACREHAARAGALVNAESTALDRASAQFAAVACAHALARSPASRLAAVERSRGALELLAQIEGRARGQGPARTLADGSQHGLRGAGAPRCHPRAERLHKRERSR